MPVFNPKPTAPPAVTEAPARALAPENKNILVDSRYVPMNAILSAIVGTPWVVDYYAQVVDKDTELSGQQLNRLGINQQYRLISQFELRVSSPLEGSQDSESGGMDLEGASNVYPCLIPNNGDMFLADIGDGRIGVFQVTDSKRLTILKGTAHEINYKWVAYATKERLDDLNSKVVKKEVFVHDYMLQEKYPFVATEDYEARLKLALANRELVPMYFKAFWDAEYATLTVPNQDRPTYDPLLVKALLAIVDTSAAPEVIRTRRLNVDGDEALKAVSIWDVLLQRSAMQLQRTFTRAALVSARAFDRQTQLESICHSGIHHVVYPLDPERSVLASKLTRRKTSITALTRAPEETLGELLPVQVLSGLDNVDGHAIQPAIPDAAATEYYVFTQAFYDNVRQEQSRLENLVHDYLNHRPIVAAELLSIVHDYPGWEAIDQFYYGPVLMLLTRVVVENY